MSRVPVHTIETAPDASRQMLEALLAGPGSGGRILNLQAQLAHSPAALGAYLGIRRSIEEHATLDLRTRSAVQLTVATVALTAFADSFVRYARTELDVPTQPIPAGA